MKPVTLTAGNFDETIDKGIVVLDFWASWCAPCRAFAPIFERAAKNHPDITFGKIDTEAEPALAAEFGIRSIPTVAAFKDGILVYSQPGLLPPDALENLITQLRALDMEKIRNEIRDRGAA